MDRQNPPLQNRSIHLICIEPNKKFCLPLIHSGYKNCNQLTAILYHPLISLVTKSLNLYTGAKADHIQQCYWVED
jgi:hypothetical protein